MASVLALAANPAVGQRASELSADLPDTRILRIQEKVETLFIKRSYARAYFIYRNELAPLGDKYAQYMVGFMHQTGLGTDKNDIVASAWYRLSAERGTPEFIAVRDDMMRTLSETDHARSDALYRDLRKQYSDLVVLMASIRRDDVELSSKTGSRIRGFSGAPVTVVDPSDGQYQTGQQYYGDIERRMHARIRLLIELGDFYELGDDPTEVDLHDLERLVEQRISSVGN